MHPAEISEGVGQVSRDGQAEASFPLELGQSIYGSRSSKAAGDCYCYIFSAYSPAPFGRIDGMAFWSG